jgi:hypothetical protein
MPGPNYVLDKGFRAQSATDAYTAVKMGTANESVTVVNVVGWLQETPSADDVTAGRVVNVRLMGITRAIAGAGIARGAPVKITADGKVITATAAGPAHGRAMFTVTADGDHVDILITPGAYVPA